MMPAFAKKEGGPLEDDQIASLVQYLTQTIPSAPQNAATVKPVAQRPALGAPFKQNVQ